MEENCTHLPLISLALAITQQLNSLTDGFVTVPSTESILTILYQLYIKESITILHEQVYSIVHLKSVPQAHSRQSPSGIRWCVISIQSNLSVGGFPRNSSGSLDRVEYDFVIIVVIIMYNYD